MDRICNRQCEYSSTFNYASCPKPVGHHHLITQRWQSGGGGRSGLSLSVRATMRTESPQTGNTGHTSRDGKTRVCVYNADKADPRPYNFIRVSLMFVNARGNK